MNQVLANAFTDELTKLAETAAGKRRRRRRTAQAIGAGALGYGAGYGTLKYLYPAMMKALGKAPKKLSPRTAALVSGLAGLSLAAMHGYGQGWVHDDPVRISKKRTGSRRGGASADRRLAERHQGSSSQVSPGLLPAAGDGVLPVHSGGRGLRNGRDSDRDNNFRRGVDKYRYGGKTPRDYNFERPFRLRESGDR